MSASTEVSMRTSVAFVAASSVWAVAESLRAAATAARNSSFDMVAILCAKCEMRNAKLF